MQPSFIDQLTDEVNRIIIDALKSELHPTHTMIKLNEIGKGNQDIREWFQSEDGLFWAIAVNEYLSENRT